MSRRGQSHLKTITRARPVSPSLITETYDLERGIIIIIIMIIIRLLMYFFPNYSPSPGRESDIQLESLEARKQRATSFARFIFRFYAVGIFVHKQKFYSSVFKAELSYIRKLKRESQNDCHNI